MGKQTSSLLSLILAVLLMFTSVDLTALAAEPIDEETVAIETEAVEPEEPIQEVVEPAVETLDSTDEENNEEESAFEEDIEEVNEEVAEEEPEEAVDANMDGEASATAIKSAGTKQNPYVLAGDKIVEKSTLTTEELATTEGVYVVTKADIANGVCGTKRDDNDWDGYFLYCTFTPAESGVYSLRFNKMSRYYLTYYVDNGKKVYIDTNHYYESGRTYYLTLALDTYNTTEGMFWISKEAYAFSLTDNDQPLKHMNNRELDSGSSSKASENYYPVYENLNSHTYKIVPDSNNGDVKYSYEWYLYNSSNFSEDKVSETDTWNSSFDKIHSSAYVKVTVSDKNTDAVLDTWRYGFYPLYNTIKSVTINGVKIEAKRGVAEDTGREYFYYDDDATFISEKGANFTVNVDSVECADSENCTYSWNNAAASTVNSLTKKIDNNETFRLTVSDGYSDASLYIYVYPTESVTVDEGDVAFAPKSYYCTAYEDSNYDGDNHGAGYPIIVAFRVKKSDFEGVSYFNSITATNLKIDGGNVTAKPMQPHTVTYADTTTKDYLWCYAVVGYFDLTKGEHTVSGNIGFSCYKNGSEKYFTITNSVSGKVECPEKEDPKTDVTYYWNPKIISSDDMTTAKTSLTFYRVDKDSVVSAIKYYKHSDTMEYSSENQVAETVPVDVKYENYTKTPNYDAFGQFFGKYYGDSAGVTTSTGYRTECYLDEITFDSEKLTTDTYIDAVVVDDKGNERVAQNAIFYDAKTTPIITSNWSVATQSMHVLNANQSNDYISIMVYGKRLTKDSIPKFYKDATCNDEDAVASYVEDGICAVVNDTENGMSFITLKKNEQWNDETEEVFYKANPSLKAIVKQQVFSVDVSDVDVYSMNLTSTGLMIYVNNNFTENNKYKLVGEVYENKKYVKVSSKEYQVKKDGSQLYIVVPTTDALYKKLAGLKEGTIGDIEVLGVTDKTHMTGGYFNPLNKAEPVAEIVIKNSGSSWKLCEFGDGVAKVVSECSGTTTEANQVVVDSAKAASLTAGKAYKLIVTDASGSTSIKTVEFNANTRKVIFNPNSGEFAEGEATSMVVTQGKPYGTLPVVTREGYVFKNWATAETAGKAITAKSVVKIDDESKTQTLVAIWTPITYKVVYNPNGAKGKAVTVSVKYDEDHKVLKNDATQKTADFTKFSYTGYDFNGWRTADGTEFVVDSTKKNLANENNVIINLYAQWTPKTYTVKIYANAEDAVNGTLTKDASGASVLEVKHDDTIYLTGREFDLPGKTITGWSDTKEGTKVKVKNGKVAITSDKELYAIWGTGKYDITYVLGDGAKGKNAVTYTYDKDLVINNPTKTGYVFDGWTVSGEGLAKVKAVEGAVDEANKLTAVDSKNKTIIPKGAEGALTLTANWKPITYKVQFFANSGDGTVEEKTVAYDGVDTILKTAFTPKAGYEFVSYSLSANGKGKKLVETGEGTNLFSLAGLSTKQDAVVKVYAIWKPITYTISIDVNGGVAAKNPDNYNITSKNITLKSPTRPGYTFDGWTITAAESVDKAENTNKTVVIRRGSYGNVSLTAKWTVNNYTVTFSNGNGTGTWYEDVYEDGVAVNGEGLSDGQLVELKAEWFYSPKYKKGTYWYLKGLYTSKNGKGTAAHETVDSNGNRIFTLDGLPDSNGKVTLYPYWINRMYNITYVSNQTEYKNPNPATVTYSKNLKLKNATKTGYVFNGWRQTWSGGYFTTTIYGYDDSKLYADFSPVKYTVKLNANGATNTSQTVSIPATYDTSIDLSSYANKYKKNGFIFLGFSTKKSGKAMTDETLANLKNLTTKNNAVVNLYPVWEKVAVAQVSGLTTAKNAEGIKVDFKAVKGTITKYEIQYSTTINFTDATTAVVPVTTNEGLVPAASLTAGKLYYVRVREVKTDSYGQVTNGKWSVVNQVKY